MNGSEITQARPATRRRRPLRRRLAAAAALLTAVAAAATVVTGCGSDEPRPQTINPAVYEIAPGIEVARFEPATPLEELPPVVLVHGGGGDWRAWDWHARRLSDQGRVVYAFSWLHHGNSEQLPEDVFVRRSILDVARVELPAVIGHALERGVGRNRWVERVDLVGRSMGGAASLAFAATNPDDVRRLAVLQPVVPEQFAPQVIPLDIAPFAPSDAGDAAQQAQLFYPTLDADTAYGLYLGSHDESPLAIYEATRWTLSIDVDAIGAEAVLAVASDPELDRITPASSIRAMAEHMGARFEQFDGIGHSDVMIVEPHRTRLADLLRDFMSASV